MGRRQIELKTQNTTLFGKKTGLEGARAARDVDGGLEGGGKGKQWITSN